MAVPALLKRGLSAPLDELLMAAEYILKEGNPSVMLCERGIRAFETDHAATLDLMAVPILKELSHLPVIVDPSHAAGRRELVLPFRWPLPPQDGRHHRQRPQPRGGRLRRGPRRYAETGSRSTSARSRG